MADAAPVEWSLWRYRHVAAWLAREARAGERLADVGCGQGNVLAHLAAVAPIRDWTAIDVDAAALAATARRVPCATVQASILDAPRLASLARGFDFVVLGDVLHHLVAGTRAGSRRLAERALASAAGLLAPRGTLLIVEPTFAPRFAATLAFHAKRLLAGAVRRRLELGASWANFGPPVVSLYDRPQIERFVAATPGLVILAREQEASGSVAGLARGRLTIVARRVE
jgi:SAM-dependent methyltransferase